ncbi:MAG: DMT family transporter [Clostridiales bacterium]|nr:DMT family transporter [Clostridiales bacterium]
MKKQLKADLTLLLVTAIWGISFPLMRNVLGSIPAIPYLALRFTIAAIILSIFFFKKHTVSKEYILKGSTIGLFLSIGMLLQVYGLYHTTASNSALITGLNVVLVPIFITLFFKRKTEKYTLIGISIAFVGLFLITGAINLTLNYGDFLTLLCAIAFAFQIIYIDKFTKKLDAIKLGIIQIWLAAILFNIIWLFFDKSIIILNLETIVILVITGILGTAFAFMVQIIVQKNTTPSHTALIFSVEPVFGLLFALIIPDNQGNLEFMTIIKVIGVILILSGTLLSEKNNILLTFKNNK